jgi:hypothetical protein
MFLARRVARLLRHPFAEWQVIAAERDEVAAICQSYVGVLALIPAGAPLAGLAVVAGRYLGAAAISAAITAAMVTWVLALGGSILAATIIEKASGAFDADGDMTQAFKLVAYACTPLWLSGASYAFGTFPLAAAAGAGWSVWLLGAGAVPVMRVPPERAPTFTLFTIAVIAVAHGILRGIFTFVNMPYFGY